MKNTFWSHPLVMLAYTLLAARAGVAMSFVGCEAIRNVILTNSSAADGFNSALSGVSGFFAAAEMYLFQVIMGGITGAAVVHLLSRFRFVAKMALLALGVGSGCAALLAAWHFVGTYGLEGAAAVYGAYLMWALALMCAAACLFAYDLKHGRDDLAP